MISFQCLIYSCRLKLLVKRDGSLRFRDKRSGIPANLAPNELEESSCTLKMYNKTNIQPFGKCQIVIRNPVNRNKYRVEFQVVSGNLNPLISRRAAEQMKLITVNYFFFHSVDRTENLINSKVFDGKFEDLPGEDNVKPVQCPVRRIPHTLKKTVKQELDDLEQKGVLIPVSEPAEWCSQISVQTKKNGSLKICIDPQQLNRALLRERYMLPVIDNIFPDLGQAKVFSKLDQQNGYCHCVLDKQSSYSTTIITPFGRYRWYRLPFGMKVSSEIFQRKLNECLAGLSNVICIVDDILVFGKNTEEHNEMLQKLLLRCSEKNIKLNKEKCVFNTSTI